MDKVNNPRITERGSMLTFYPINFFLYIFIVITSPMVVKKIE